MAPCRALWSSVDLRRSTEISGDPQKCVSVCLAVCVEWRGCTGDALLSWTGGLTWPPPRDCAVATPRPVTLSEGLTDGWMEAQLS